MSGMDYPESRSNLKDFVRKHAVWDPMPLWDGQRFLLYVLGIDRGRGEALGSFFTRENSIHVFESTDRNHWQHLGIAIAPRDANERLCAGNPVYHAGRYWFFGSATVDQYDENHLDQRLFLMVSDNGVDFRTVPEFSLEPDPDVCLHNRFHPDDGRMLFAWRDPWPMFDEQSGRFLVFICTGGERWGCAPDVVVAEAPDLVGPYRLLGSVLDLPTKCGGTSAPAFSEIERINVLAMNGRWYLTFSCWLRLVDQDVLAQYARVDESLSDYTVYVASSTSPIGPFGFIADRQAMLHGSSTSGCYGTTFFRSDEGVTLALGWDCPAFRVRPARIAQLQLQPTDSSDDADLALHWPWSQVLQMRASQLLRRGVRILRAQSVWLRWRLTALRKRVYVD